MLTAHGSRRMAYRSPMLDPTANKETVRPTGKRGPGIQPAAEADWVCEAIRGE